MVELLGVLGMLLLLTGFVLNLLSKLEHDSALYIWLNILGGFILAVYALLINSLPFLILELIWSLFALSKIFKKRLTE